mmetsp:Transcript_41345/g.107060  ORF Transcript_41345/g.107060 Transcript_41345/m.107060 type:complete len:462 (+) Transcript_41345:558-1943(+)
MARHDVHGRSVAAVRCILHALRPPQLAAALVRVVVPRPHHVHPVPHQQLLQRLPQLRRHRGVRVLGAGIGGGDVEGAVAAHDQPRCHAPVHALQIRDDKLVLTGAGGKGLLGAHLKKVDGAVVKGVPLLPAARVRHPGPELVRHAALAARVEDHVKAVPGEGVVALVVAHACHPGHAGRQGLDLVVEHVPLSGVAPGVGYVAVVDDEAVVAAHQLPRQARRGVQGGAHHGELVGAVDLGLPHVRHVQERHRGVRAGHRWCHEGQHAAEPEVLVAILVEVLCVRHESRHRGGVHHARVDPADRGRRLPAEVIFGVRVRRCGRSVAEVVMVPPPAHRRGLPRVARHPLRLHLARGGRQRNVPLRRLVVVHEAHRLRLGHRDRVAEPIAEQHEAEGLPHVERPEPECGLRGAGGGRDGVAAVFVLGGRGGPDVRVGGHHQRDVVPVRGRVGAGPAHLHPVARSI